MEDSPKQELKQQQQSLQKGAQVEVTSDEDGFKGAWYPATIIDHPSPTKKTRRRDSALVQYATLVTDPGSALLKEHVDPTLIRPLPPPPDDPEPVFELNDVVDAWHKDGWWTGVVRKAEGSWYRVYFDNPPDIIEFRRKDLRHHLDWVDGSWVRPGRMETSESDHSVFGCGEAVEVNIEKGNVRDGWFPAFVIKENGDNTFLVKLAFSKSREVANRIVVGLQHIRPALSCSSEKCFELLEKVEAWFDFCWRPGVITKVLASDQFNVFFKQGNEDKEFKKAELRPHLVWVDGKWKSKDSKMTSDSQEQRTQAVYEDGMVEVDVKYENSGANIDAIVLKAPHSISISSLMDQPFNSNEKPLLDVFSLSKKKIKLAPPSGRGSIEKHVAVDQPSAKVDGQLSGSTPGHEKLKGRRSIQKRKRGRPTRFVVEMPNTIKAGFESKGGPCVGVVKNMALKDRTGGVEPLTETGHESAEKLLVEELDNDVGITEPVTSKADNGHRPLFPFVRPCSTSVEASRFWYGPLANRGSETTAAAVDCPANRVKQNHVDDGGRCLPFQKESPIWKAVESMEVFQLMPQSPHFLTLMNNRDDYREGTAIGLMVTFASLFDKVSSLRFDDPRSVFESIWESLLILESHGFDIEKLQDRLSALLWIKDGETGFLNESLHTEKLLTEQATERKVLAGKMEEIQKEIAKLHEEYAASEAKMHAMNQEISKLQKEVDSVRMRILDDRRNFEQLVNAPWRSP